VTLNLSIDVVSASQSLNHLPNPAIHPAEAAILCTPMNHQSKSLGRQMTFCQTVALNPSPGDVETTPVVKS